MIKDIDSTRASGWVLLCIACALLALFAAGPVSLLACLSGIFVGAALGEVMVRLCGPHSATGAEPEELEPALVPVLLGSEGQHKGQLKAAVLELIGGGNLLLDSGREQLYLLAGEEGAQDAGRCASVAEIRIKGRLLDGPLPLQGLSGHLASGQGRSLQDIEKVSQEAYKSWCGKAPKRIRASAASLLLALAAFAFVFDIFLGGAALGLAIGLCWPSPHQLERLSRKWAAQRSAWQLQAEGFAQNLPVPHWSSWPQIAELALALEDEKLLSQMEQRLAAQAAPDKRLVRLMEAARVLFDD